MAGKVRIDRLLVERGLYPSRERAQSALMAGVVWVDGARVDKAGANVSETADIRIKGPDLPFVSRGGLKLEKALVDFGWDVTDLECIDLGASTGGFTDCLLQRGARSVVAVDVGRGQLDLKLRNDPRVTVMEKVNARYLTLEQLPYRADLVTADLAFISLRLVYAVVSAILKPGRFADQASIRGGPRARAQGGGHRCAGPPPGFARQPRGPGATRSDGDPPDLLPRTRPGRKYRISGRCCAHRP